MIPTLIYAYLFFKPTWSKAKMKEATTLTENLKAMVSPLFIFMFICVFLTAIS